MKKEIRVNKMDRLYRMTRSDLLNLFTEELTKAGFNLNEQMKISSLGDKDYCEDDIIIVEQDDKYKVEPPRSSFETIPSAIK